MKFLKIIDGYKNNKVEYVNIAEIGEILLSFSCDNEVVKGASISIKRKGENQNIAIDVEKRIMVESNQDEISEQIKKAFMVYFEGKLKEISKLPTNEEIFVVLNKDELALSYGKIVEEAENRHYQKDKAWKL